MSPSRPLDTRPSVMSLQVNVDKGPEGLSSDRQGSGEVCFSGVCGEAGGGGALYPDSIHSVGLLCPFSR